MNGPLPARAELCAKPLVSCRPRWLFVEFARDHQVVSWAIVGGGVRRARVVAWHEIANRELCPPVDAADLLTRRLRRVGCEGAVGMLTSRRLEAYVDVVRSYRSLEARCIATVGLGNALRAGDPPGPSARIGTINLLCCVSVPLAPECLFEVLALAAEARAIAVRDAGVLSTVSARPASGTGTDCIVVAAPAASAGARYAGKHTALGHVVGAAVADAIGQGAEAWLSERRRYTQ